MKIYSYPFIVTCITFVVTLITNIRGELLLIGGTCGINQIIDPLHNRSEIADVPLRPISDRNSQALRIRNLIYLIGGGDLNIHDWVQMYDIERNETIDLQPMNSARYHHTATNVGDDRHILVCGGMDEQSGILDTCEMYDLAYGNWSELMPMPSIRRVHAAALIHGGQGGGRRVMLMGGLDDQRSVVIFDPVTAQWSNASDMLDPRYGQSAVPLDDGAKVIMCGGANIIDAYKECEIYDVISDTWLRMAPMQRARFGFAMLFSKGLLWNIAGMDFNDLDLSSSEVYNPVINQTLMYTELSMVECSFFSVLSL